MELNEKVSDDDRIVNLVPIKRFKDVYDENALIVCRRKSINLLK